MRRSLLLTCAAGLTVALVAGAPSHAQNRVELELGANYALISDDFAIEQEMGFHARARYAITNRLQLGLTYEERETEGDIRPLRFRFVDTLEQENLLTGQTDLISARDFISSGGDASLTLYGLNGVFVITGESDMQLYAVASVGQGELDYENPGRDVVWPEKVIGDGVEDRYTFEEVSLTDELGLVEDTDIDFWYEVGAGIRFGFGQRWGMRLQVTFRRLSPEEPAVVMENGVSEVFPSASATFRF
jgi:hypothetical protein